MAAPTRETLVLACETLSERDAALAKAYALHGLPEWRLSPANYSTLARTVTYQQISLSAAGAIWERVLAHFGSIENVTARAMLDTGADVLGACGLSRPKVAHLRSIADAVENGNLNLADVLASTHKDALEALVSVKGIGPWTGEIFLLYSGNVDAFPVGDIGLMNAYQMLSGAEDRLGKAEFSKVAENWRPYRGVAAHLLWAHIHAERAKET